jgi:hypothetical protein
VSDPAADRAESGRKACIPPWATRRKVEDLGQVAVEGEYVEGGNWRSDAATVTASSWDGILVTRNVLETPSGSSAWDVPAGILGFFLDT